MNFTLLSIDAAAIVPPTINAVTNIVTLKPSVGLSAGEVVKEEKIEENVKEGTVKEEDCKGGFFKTQIFI